MFRYLCSYHQVSPNFLKLVHSLGDQIEYNKKFHAVGFFDEILFKTSPGRSLGVPGLGRSGSEYRTYYQLQAMEYSPESGNNWVIRQTTVYYSFDLETARCFWITVKGGPGLRTRIQDQNKTQHDVQPEALQDLCGAFQASLATHLTHLEWCTEGWRWAIDHKEARIRGALDRVGAAPIKQEKTREFVRFVSFTPDSKNQGSERMTFEGGISRPSSWRTFLTKDERHEYQHVVKEADNAFRQCKTQEQNIIRQGRILDGFSILEFQDLTSDTMILQEVKLAMTLNIDVLRGIRDSYQSFLKSPECPKKIRNKCQGIIRHFQRRIKSLERELSIECRRADTLISQLQEAKPLVKEVPAAYPMKLANPWILKYDLILQYRNAEMNKFLAFNAHYASVRMESVGERTERLTSSMHIITLFTLLLLPGTFLGVRAATSVLAGS